MPRRSEREDYAHAFQENPFAGLDAGEIYSELRWGDTPNEQWEIHAPEPLAGLGELAALHFSGRAPRHGNERWDEDEGPFVAVGANSNRVYLIPRDEQGAPIRRIPEFTPNKGWVLCGRLKRTDYYSVKAGEPAYYYHDHEKPYPTLWEHRKSGVRLLVPARHNGKRSYGVVKEGIVG